MPCCAAERKNHSVDISVQFMGVPGVWYGSRETRVTSRGGQEKGTIVTAYVLYCFDGNAVWYCYCSKLGSCVVVCAWYCTAGYCLFCVDRVKVVRYLF